MSGELKVEAKGQMLSVQYSLPHLPVPPLEQTMEKYLQTVRPLLTQDQFANTQKVGVVFVLCFCCCGGGRGGSGGGGGGGEKVSSLCMHISDAGAAC